MPSSKLCRQVLLVAVLLCGCSRPKAAPSDPNLADETIKQALDAWVAGENPKSLASKSPAIVVIEPEWERGTKITSYQIQPGRPVGNAIVFPVTLTKADGKKVTGLEFRVETNSPRVVSRDGDD